MNKQDFAKLQTCALKVDIQCHCDGCKKKVKKELQKVEGVYTTKIDADQGKVTVTGNVNPATLIKKLSKSGKHAELWAPQKGTNNNFQQQFNNFQLNNQKVGKDSKSQKGSSAQQKGGGGGAAAQQLQAQHQLMQQLKGSKGDAMKNQKPVKFNLNDEEFEGSEDDYDDEEFDDESDESDDEDSHYHNQQATKGHQLPNKMVLPMGNGKNPHELLGMMKAGGGKKGGAVEIPVLVKGKNDSKHGNNGGTKGGDGDKKGKGGGKGKQGGKDSNGGKGIMQFLGFGKKSKKGSSMGDSTDNKSASNGRVGGGGGAAANNNGGGAKHGKGKTDGAHEFKKTKNDFANIDHVIKPAKGGGGGGPKGTSGGGHAMGGDIARNMGQMGSMGPTGQMGQMGSYGHIGLSPAVQGLPAGAMNNGGYYNAMGAGPPMNPYGQQYMPMMMNQQHGNNMNDMYHMQMMHGRPNPSMNYMPPPPMPPHPSVPDPYSHFFSDENTSGSCSIM